MPAHDDHDTGGPAPVTVRPGEFTALLRELVQAPEPKVGVTWAGLLPGARIGRFELGRELGRGGFGVVWEALDTGLGRAVALKLVRAGEVAAIREERMLREAEAAAQLSHPNIVTLFDVGRSEHGPFLVYELLRGRTLHHRIASGPMSPREAVQVATEIAAGIAYAHERGVVHRDLKPANVLVCDDGRVKVLDFGLARALGRRLQDGGTPGYMAPEQWIGAPEDERTDVFALGVILYRMLTLRMPFPDGARHRRLASLPPAPPLDFPGCPRLGALVASMLERDPVKRPRDGAEVLGSLTAVAAELVRCSTAESGRVSVRGRGRLALRRFALGAAILAAAAAGFVASRRHVPNGAESRGDSLTLPAGTKSLEAYQHHLRANELRMRDCDYAAAEEEERRALALDPEFGAAHAHLGLLLLINSDARADSSAHFRAARSLADSMPDRERRLILLERYVTPTVPLTGDKRVHEREALSGFDSLVERYPDDPHVLYAAGWAQQCFGRWDGAISLYSRSLAVDPGQCFVVNALTLALHRAGRGAEVVAIERRAVAARPNATNLALLASGLYQNGYPEEAAEHARDALRAPRAVFDAKRVAACALAAAGHPDEAESVADDLIASTRHDPFRRMAEELRAFTLGLQGRGGEAVRAWPGDDPRFPVFDDARASLSSIGRPRRDSPEALRRLRAAQGPELLAGELAFHGDVESAEEVARTLPANSVQQAYYTALALEHQRRWEEAIPALRALVIPFGDRAVGVPDARLAYQIKARVALGEALLEAGRPAEALEAMSSADAFGACSVDAAVNLPRIWIARARALERLDRPVDAVKVLDRFIQQWRRADADLPILSEAKAMRERLATVGGASLRRASSGP